MTEENDVERKTFHFDLAYVPHDAEFTITVGDRKFPLHAHTDETRQGHRRKNRALALMPDHHLARLSHYAEDVELPSNLARVMKVTYPHPDGETLGLPALAVVKLHVPAAARRRRREAVFAKLTNRPHPVLARYGVPRTLAGTAPKLEDTVALHEDADAIGDSPLDVAKTLIFHHPQLASRNPDTAAAVETHIDQVRQLNSFATLIARLGPATEQGGWATISKVVDQDGSDMTWGNRYESAGKKSGEPVTHYRLNDAITGTADAAPDDRSGMSAVSEALQTTQDDGALRNTKWSVNPGSPDLAKTADAPKPVVAESPMAEVEGTAGYSFTLNNRTPGYGVEVKKSSLDFLPDASDPSKATFAIASRNTYLRTLCAYVEFVDINGKPIPNPAGWKNQLEYLGPLADELQSDTQKYVAMIPAVSVILGIPMPTDATGLSFPWPEDAVACNLYHGGLGTRDWNTMMDIYGTILTGIFQYGVPVLFLVAGAAVTNSSWYKSFIEDKDLVAAVAGVGFGVVGGAVATAAALLNTKRVLFALGNTVAGILVSQAAGKLAVYIARKITAAEVVESVPIAGWTIRIASMVITTANLAETTVEVLISPATYKLEVKRELALEVTVSPDPLHGTPSQKPVWPETADHYEAIVRYKNGTNYKMNGQLPTDPSKRADPVVVRFPELPAGGQIQILFGAYSSTHWLAGNWTSGELPAVLPDGQDTLTLAGAIQEQLVPLSKYTQYRYDKKLTYDPDHNKHVWHKGDQPTALIGALNAGSTGHNLAKLVDLTINNKANMLGYCWQASGQNLPFCGSSEPTDGQLFAFQNINTLANPEGSLKFPNCGFAAQPYLVYDQFGPAPLFSLPNSAKSDLDNRQISSAIAGRFTANQQPLPGDATVKVVQSTVRWYISVGRANPSYDLRRETDGTIGVYAYPTSRFSQNNFYVDPRTGNYHLRKVILDDTTPFDMAPTLSYGYFQSAHLDSVKIHPAGYAVGVSFKNSKLEIIKIPDQGVEDSKAEPAIPASGFGVRQGLLNGPIAIAITANGRILVLEQLNKRVQSFDLNGNPSPCFDGATIVTLDAATFAPDLNKGLVSTALRQQFAINETRLTDHWRILDGSLPYDITPNDSGSLSITLSGATLSDQWTIKDTSASYPVQTEGNKLVVYVDGAPAFDLDETARSYLERSTVSDTIVATFEQNNLILSPQAEATGNGLTIALSEEDSLAMKVISEPIERALASRGITLSDSAVVIDIVTIKIEKTSGKWILTDGDTALSYKIETDASQSTVLNAVQYLPFMALHSPDKSDTVTYLDIGAEMQGYVYVLQYTGDGTKLSDYLLDIYEPSGKWLSRTPDTSLDANATGVNGGRLVVDMWRNIFTVNFEHFLGPGGRTEPSISTWIPTTSR